MVSKGDRLVLKNVAISKGSPDVVMAYLDIATRTIIDLRTVKNDGKQGFGNAFWTDNNRIIYGLNTTTSPYNFSLGSTKIYEEDVTTSTADAVSSAPAGSYLEQVVFY
jgi:hypothetical protein